MIWQENGPAGCTLYVSPLPALQPVYPNRNTVVVTPALAARAGDAAGLLDLWNAGAGVDAVSRYPQLTPTPTVETLTWAGGVPSGTNFPLAAGGFLLATFDGGYVLDLGPGATGPVDLAAGASAVAHTSWPDDYSAYRLLRELGLANARGVRILDAATGRWRVAASAGGGIVGENFPIPRTAVLFTDLDTAAPDFVPGGGD